MALRELRSHGSFSRVPVSLDPSGVEAIRLLRDRLTGGKPRTIHAAWQEKPMIVFTDGALEENSSLGAPATVGGVLFDPKKPGRASAFGSMVPSELLQHWRSDGKTHVIGLVELYASVLALRYWRKRLEGRRIILFVDSWPVLDALVKGDSSVRLWRELLLVLENPEERLPLFLWVARVPSKSNIADPPSKPLSAQILISFWGGVVLVARNRGTSFLRCLRSPLFHCCWFGAYRVALAFRQVAITAALERSDRGLSAGELNKRSAWFNTETSELKLNDLFRFIRDLLHSEFLKTFLRAARFAILDEFQSSESDS